MPTPKKDESVKTGLEIEGQTPIGKAHDADEMVHEQLPETPENTAERDIDELVHELPPTVEIDHTREIDPDDLVHDPAIKGDEEQ